MATLKGIWVFNEVITSSASFDYGVEFVSNGIDYNRIFVGVGSYGCEMAYVPLAGNTLFVYDVEWFYPKNRTVDFGTTGQTVDDDFYTWVAENAIHESNLPKVSGVWKFNETLVQSTFNCVWQDVKFTCNGVEYLSMVDDGGDNYNYIGYSLNTEENNKGGSGILWAYPGEWEDEAYRIVDFGSTEQIVESIFYTWFTANAIQQASEPTPTTTLKGIWVFNETPQITPSDNGGILKQTVNFKVLDAENPNYLEVEYVGISAIIPDSTGIVTSGGFVTESSISYLRSDGSGDTSYYDGEWGYCGQGKTIDFGSTEQEVSDEFYTWFIASATQQTAEEEEPTVLTKKFTRLYISEAVASSSGRVWKKLSAESEVDDSIVGTWIFNDTLTFEGEFDYEVDFDLMYDDAVDVHYVAMSYQNNAYESGFCFWEHAFGAGGSKLLFYDVNTNSWRDDYNEYEYRFTGGKDIDNPELKAWLKANATKVS